MLLSVPRHGFDIQALTPGEVHEIGDKVADRTFEVAFLHRIGIIAAEAAVRENRESFFGQGGSVRVGGFMG